MIQVRHRAPNLLTDGALEQVNGKPVATVGGVLLVPHGMRVFYYAAQLEGHCIERLMKASENPISAIELLAIVAGMRLWHAWLRDCSCISFIDDDASRHALIRAYSANQELCAFCELATHEEAAQQALFYFECVSSAANISDAPSRGVAPA